MPYLDCPRCRARFHTGEIYERLEFCPRCGASFNVPRPSIGQRIRALVARRGTDQVPDWERITGSQYAGRRVSRVQREHDDSAPATP